MAQSHHRKKHKSHLRQFRQSKIKSSDSAASRTKAAIILAILGAVVGFAVGYFASGGHLIWIISCLAGGIAIGYYIGKRIDEGS
jgi:uncharacterized membrane protein YfcA